ncbi:MAG: hypothetical protein JO232_16195, partial [Verrucomicrobia bacterium]|nr:hypothetical protein [Verrucomicrobiota bacterium]
MNFELNTGDIFILFFLTLGPLKAILPFARVTHGTDLAFQRKMAWRSTAIATVIALAVALLAPLVLGNWHVSRPAISIALGIILFAQALRIVMQTPAPGSAEQQASPSPPSPAIAVFPLAIPAILTAPGIAAIAVIVIFYKHDLAHEAIVIAILLGVMVLNLLTLWNNETILKHGLAGILPIVGWVMAVLQAALAVQIIIHALLLEAAGLPEPVSVNGVQQRPIEGVSMLYSFDDAKAAEQRETQYFEMFGNRGIYHKGWTAVTKHGTPWVLVGRKTVALDDDVWELYDTSKDWSQA